MNKKEIYKKVVELLKKYRSICINEDRHDSYTYGFILGLLESLYLSGAIDIFSSIEINDFARKKMDLYFNER